MDTLQKEIATNAKNIADVEKIAGDAIVTNIIDNANKKVDSSNKATANVTSNKQRKGNVIQIEMNLLIK